MIERIVLRILHFVIGFGYGAYTIFLFGFFGEMGNDIIKWWKKRR